MVTCNLCGQNKKVEEIQNPFRYVCKDCFENMTIGINGHEIDKELIY